MLFATPSLATWEVNIILENKLEKVKLIQLFLATSLASKYHGAVITNLCKSSTISILTVSISSTTYPFWADCEY